MINENAIKKRKVVLSIALICTLMLVTVWGYFSNGVFYAEAESIYELNRMISENKNEIEKLEKRMKLYEEKIKETRGMVVNLKNQLELLESEIEKSDIDIEITEKQIEKTILEIQKIKYTIDEYEKKIELQKNRLADFIKALDENDQVSNLELLLRYQSLSEYYNHYRQIIEIQNSIYSTIGEIRSNKAHLAIQKDILEEKKDRELELKKNLEIKKAELLAQAQQKEMLITETQLSEKRFQNYVAELKREQEEINNEIIALEKKVREEIEKKKREKVFEELGPLRLDWPVPGREITATFHDPDYPYRYIFEHPAIDIRAAQGTPVRASEAGYVGSVKNGGIGGYSYIMIIHKGGVSTVYGHLSAIHVQPDQFVNKGDIIGLSGGQPGTPGAGRLTTGPHLHFEVRKDGIPVNPLDYLP